MIVDALPRIACPAIARGPTPRSAARVPQKATPRRYGNFSASRAAAMKLLQKTTSLIHLDMRSKTKTGALVSGNAYPDETGAAADGTTAMR